MKAFKFALLAALLAVSHSAFALIASGTCGVNGDNLSWVLYEDNRLEISGTGAMSDYSRNYNSYVTTAPWGDYWKSITSVVISPGVTRIGDYAFSGCVALTYVSIPNSVTKIGMYSFYKCTGLTYLTIPKSVTSIGSAAFLFCSSLTDVTCLATRPPTGGDSFSKYGTLHVLPNCGDAYRAAAGWKDNFTIAEDVIPITQGTCSDNLAWTFDIRTGELKIEGTGELGDYSFDKYNGLNIYVTTAPWGNYWKSITSVVISPGVTRIGNFAFYGCSGLTSVTIPNSVTSISICAFCKCSSLTSLDIPNSVTSIGESAFHFCSGLTSVTIPNSVTDIGNYTFEECWGLTSITLGNSVDKIGMDAFYGCSNVKKLIFAEGTKIVLRTGLKSITSVTIPNSVTSIGVSAFWNCSGLTSVTIPNSVTNIGNGAFEGCSCLTSINIPNSVEVIGERAFNGCTDLTSITLGNSVTSISNYAFQGCSSLTDVTCLAKTPPTCKLNSFSTYGTLHVLPNCGDAYRAATFWKNFTIVEDAGDDEDSVIHGTCGENLAWTFDTGTGKLNIEGSGAMNNYSCTIQNGKAITTAPWGDYHQNIKTVTISQGVTSIGDMVFEGCSELISVTIPNSVTSIGLGAFEGCSGLTSATIPSSITSIDASAFMNCTGLTSVTIPQSVTIINNAVFQNCSGLTSVTIPNSVTNIRNWAFQNCSSLTSVTCEATTVPTTGTGLFQNVDLSAVTLIVPKSALSSYQGTSPWSEFGTIQGFETSVASGTCGAEGDNLTWTLYDDGNLVIEGTGAMRDCSIRNFDDLYITTAPWGDYYQNIKSVTISQGVTGIGDMAFFGCSHFTSVAIPNSVTSIGVSAFWNCSGLTSVTIPNSVTNIGNGAFANCSCLTSINIPNSVTSIGDVAFSSCSGLISVTIGNSVTSIGNSAFGGCYSLTSVTCEATTVPTTGTGLFQSIDLSAVTLIVPKTALSSYQGTSPWSEFGTIQGFETSIASGTCGAEGDNITWTLYDDGNLVIEGSGSMNNYKIYAMSDGTGLTAAPWRFYYQTITAVTINEEIANIGDGAFAGCLSLASVTIPNTVTKIGDSAFHNCRGLTSVTIPNSVTSIGNSAFDNCSDLTSVTIPNSVTNIEDWAFSECPSLTEINAQMTTPPAISLEVFDNVDKSTCKLIVPAGSVDAYKKADVWKEFTNIVPFGTTGLRGDINGDGVVNIQDVTELVDIILGKKK